MLRGILITFHLIGLVASVCLLLATYQTPGLIATQAKDRAIGSVRTYADEYAKQMREALDRPTLGKWLDGRPRAAIEQQLRSYQEGPEVWLLRLFEGGREQTSELRLPEVTNPFARKTLELIQSERSKLKQRMAQRYQSLLHDLRVFAATNAAAFLCAALLCTFRKSTRAKYWLTGYSLLLLISLALSINFYAGQNWTWNLLMNDYSGWGYALSILMIFPLLYLTRAPSLIVTAPPSEKKPQP